MSQSRIRTIKPELFLHDELWELEEKTGLPVIRCWIGLFTKADRDGRFNWRIAPLKAAIAPYDSFDFDHVLDALLAYGFVLKYEVDGAWFGCIPSWKHHQSINGNERKSRLPDVSEASKVSDISRAITRVTERVTARATERAQTGLFSRVTSRVVEGREGKGTNKPLSVVNGIGLDFSQGGDS